MEKIRLTQTVQKGGCAAKVAAAELRKILSHVKFPARHADLLVDGSHFDDAAIYRVSDDLALVQTIDFFTPIIDDPYTFGKLAACNALSDVYAMGGCPTTAMAVLAFPLATMDGSVIAEILQGGSDMIGEAGANFVGGHSIDDDTLKFGLSVTGFVHPDRVWSNQGAKAGDALILTKPLGTGTLTAALKRGVATESDIQNAIVSMTTLNNAIDFMSAEQADGVHAATDITGFGLSGHSWQMAKASDKVFLFDFDRLPVFAQARDFIEREFLTKAHRTNREYTAQVMTSPSLAGWQSQILHDPQTSGGLLLSVDPQQADGIVDSLRQRFSAVARVGVVEQGAAPGLFFETSSRP